MSQLFTCSNPACGRTFKRQRRLASRSHYRTYCCRECFLVHGPDIRERFLRHVAMPESSTPGCWLWTGATTGRPPFEYGTTSYQQRDATGKSIKTIKLGAHRMAYQLFLGPIPTGLSVLHSCDVPLCVNPAHLFTGTLQDNMDDRNRKHRQATGERHGRHRWPAEVIDAALADIALGAPVSTTAKAHNISRYALRYHIAKQR